MSKFQIVEIIILAVGSLIAAAKAIIAFVKHTNKLKMAGA